MANHKEMAGPANKGLKVVPKRAGFRRAGISWPEEGKVVPLSELTQQQYEQIKGEAMLVSFEVDIQAEAGAEGDAKSGGGKAKK